MRVLVISDIHANLTALEAVLKDERYKEAAMEMSAKGAVIQEQQIPTQLLSEYARRLVAY